MSVPVPRISKEDLKQRLDSGTRVVLVDARLKYPYEHSTVILPGAVRVMAGTTAPPLPRDCEIVVYDSDPSELASSDVAAALIREGYRAAALKEGRIDAAMIAPPFSVDLTNLGYTTLGQTLDHLPRYQGSVGVTTRRWAEKNGDTLVAYLRAYRQSLQWVLDPANRDACIAHLARDFALAPEIAGPTYDVLAKSKDGLYPDAHIDVPGIQTVLDLRVENRLLEAPGPDPLKYYDTSYLSRS